MRVYIATTLEQIKQLLAGSVIVEDFLTPEHFDFDSGIDEEEREHLVSLLAAEDSIQINNGKGGFVLAADLSDEQLAADSIHLSFSQIAALLYSEDGEELSWYAPGEIEFHIDGFIK